jgi:putative membrane protein
MGLALTSLAGCGDAPFPADAPTLGAPREQHAGFESLDQRFVQLAVGDGWFDAEAARLAQQRTTDPMVKAFAAMLLQHGADTGARLRLIARTRGIEWPASVPPAKQAAIEALAGLSGDDFDRRFIEHVGIDRRQSGIRLFEAASLLAGDEELRGWARQTLKLFREQLAVARQLPLAAPARAALLV